jgi:hypothetical protein
MGDERPYDRERDDLSYGEPAVATKAAPTEVPPVVEEAERVVLWREAQAVELGLSRAKAVRFADGRGDLGLLRRLVGGGCRPALAFRIAHEE